MLGDYTYRDFARLLACDRMREDHDVFGEVCVYVNKTNDPQVYTDDMAGWLVFAPQKKPDLRKCEIYDALYGGE